MRSSLVHAAVVVITSMTLACSGESDETAGSGAAQTADSSPAMPSSAADLEKLGSGELAAIFNGELAKQNTLAATALPNGPYDGTPLCRKDILPTGSELPQGVRDIHGAKLLIDLLHISN